MTMLYMIAFLIMVFGLFRLFNISLLGYLQDWTKLFCSRRPPLAKRVRKARKPPKETILRSLAQEVQEVLYSTGRRHQLMVLALIGLALFLVGVLLSLAIDNLLLLPFLATGLAISPFIYILFTAGSFRKRLAGELESALSVITSSYLRSENIIHAVEENLPHLHPPVSEAFVSFVAQCRFVSADIGEALDTLESKFSNIVFREWVAAVKSCQQDRTLKATLTPIVAKLSDTRIVTGEVEVIMKQPIQQYVIMVLLLVFNPALLYVLNKSWFTILIDTLPGKACLAVSALVIVISLIGVARVARPIEFKK